MFGENRSKVLNNKSKISVVVPLYNEEGNVEPLQKEIDEALRNAGLDYELILVDDGSNDATLLRIDRKPNVQVLELKKNSGQSAAMLAGIQAARGKIIALLDGDLQNDPADIPRLLEKIDEGFDLVCGYRVNRKDSAFRQLQGSIANAVRSRFTKDGVRDTGCTLKAMRAECRGVLIPFNGMHRFIPALVKGAGFNVTEIPVNHRSRSSGSSKYGGGLKRAIPATIDMLGVRWLLKRHLFVRTKKRDD